MEKVSVLIIESHKNLGLTFRLLFERAGHRVTIASDGDQALDYLKQDKYHAILINQQSLDGRMMNLLTGLSNSITEKTHVIFLISDSQTIPRIPTNDLLCLAYLTVPIRPEELLQQITDLPLEW